MTTTATGGTEYKKLRRIENCAFASSEMKPILREFVTSEEVERAVALTDCVPYMLPIHRTIYIFHKRSEYGFVWCKPNEVPNAQEFHGAFAEFCDLVNLKSGNMLIAPEYLTKMVTEHLSMWTTLSSKVLSTYLYYMKDSQQISVLNHDLGLPDGYHFDKAIPEIDADAINSTWKYASGDRAYTVDKLKRLPSVIVRRNGKAVAFVMCDPSGFYNHLFVYEAHRRRGIGKSVELRLSQIFIEHGYCPFKTVVTSNKQVVEWSNRSPFWTRVVDHKDKPIVVNFISLV